MQTIWDLLPASLWPTQPFIPPDQQARVMQALWAQQASANSLAAAPANRGGSAQALAPASLASGGGDASTTGGILGPLARGGGDVNTAGGILSPVLGQAANFPPATDPPILPPPTPDTYASGPGRNAQLTASPAQRPPGGTDMAGIGAGPTAAPGLVRAVGDLPAHARHGVYWLAQHGVDTALPPPADWAAAPSQPQTSSTTSDILWALPRGLMLGSGDFINSAAAADDPDILWGKYLAGQDLPDIADQQQRQLAEVQRATADAQRRVRQSVGMPAEASTRAGRLVEGGARFLGNPITWLGGPEGFGAKALTGFLSGVGSEAGGELAAGTKWETPMRLVGSIAGPMVPVAGARAFNSLYDALPSGVGALGGKLVQPTEAELIRNWLGIAPERFRGTIRLDPPLVDGTILDANGRPVALINRSFSRDTGVADHGALMLLRDELQGDGLSKDILRANIDYYRQLGLSRVDVNAGLDRGGYAWARYGFVPNRESWDTLRAGLRAKVSDPRLNLTDAERQATLDLLENRDPRTIWDIADDRTPTVINGQPLMFRGKSVPLGNHLLSGMDWQGSLDLNDVSVMRRFDDYVGPKR